MAKATCRSYSQNGVTYGIIKHLPTPCTIKFPPLYLFRQIKNYAYFCLSLLPKTEK